MEATKWEPEERRKEHDVRLIVSNLALGLVYEMEDNYDRAIEVAQERAEAAAGRQLQALAALWTLTVVVLERRRLTIMGGSR